jgi:hypothetical protein
VPLDEDSFTYAFRSSGDTVFCQPVKLYCAFRSHLGSSCDQVHVWLLQLVKLYCACSRTRWRYSVLSAWLINRGIIFFSHNKSALASLSAAETIGRTAPLNICSFVHCDSLACLIALDQEIGNKATTHRVLLRLERMDRMVSPSPVSSIAHPFCFSC